MPIKMPSIPHFDQATYSQLCSFFSSNSNNYLVTEKVDGSNISFGWQNDKFYIKTKKAEPYFTVEPLLELQKSYPNNTVIPYFIEFFNDMLEIERQIKCTDIQYICELVYNNKPNIIEYTQQKVVVILRVIVDDIDVTNTQEGSEYIRHLTEKQFHNKWTFMPKCSVENVDLYFLKKTWDNDVKLFSRQIECRKKDIKSINEREDAKKLFQYVKDTLKRSMISSISGKNSFLGAKEIEGIIIENRDNNVMMKVVDLSNFGERRKVVWEKIDNSKLALKELKDRLISEIFSNADILANKEKQSQKILESAFDFNKKKDKSLEDWVLNVIFEDILNEVFISKSTVATRARKILWEYVVKIPDIDIAQDVSKCYNSMLSIGCEKELIRFIIGKKQLSELIKAYET